MTPEAAHEIIQSDFFLLPPELDGTFDYVLEYTCYSAIDPKRHAEYVDKVAGFLKPGGKYIALAFPLDDHEGGPPFAVDADVLIKAMEHSAG